jgi:hypothetical protein
MTDLIERKQGDLDSLTIAIASGYAMTMAPGYAAEWAAKRTQAPVSTPEAVQRQAGSIGRLAAMFPGAVRTRAH